MKFKSRCNGQYWKPKWPQFCRGHSKVFFHGNTFICFYSNFTDVCSLFQLTIGQHFLRWWLGTEPLLKATLTRTYDVISHRSSLSYNGLNILNCMHCGSRYSVSPIYRGRVYRGIGYIPTTVIYRAYTVFSFLANSSVLQNHRGRYTRVWGSGKHKHPSSCAIEWIWKYRYLRIRR